MIEDRGQATVHCVSEVPWQLALARVGDERGANLSVDARNGSGRLLRQRLRAQGKLAPRTIRQVYGVLATMFRSAIADELIEATPCVLQRGVLPKKADKDPEWRATAIFTREEVEQLISDTRIPEDRRVLYALKALAGLRHGEAAALCWRQYDASLEPLGAINLGRTKTGVPRRVPVHATLARALAEWKLSGFERTCTYGRAPEADDLIAPARTLAARHKSDAAHAFHDDLATLGLRLRRAHDLRRTFITLAQVERRAPRSARNDHARPAWRHHQRLHVVPVAGAVRGSRQAADFLARGADPDRGLCYRACYSAAKSANALGKSGDPTGIAPDALPIISLGCAA